jgi:hypothetical protein
VVLSTESFVWLIPLKIQQLKDMLQGFDVTVIAVYRKYISHLISFHFQLNKWMNGHFEPFGIYNMRTMDYAQTERGRNYMSLLGDWQQVFGKDALQIVDYFGAIAAGKSIPNVVLCEAGGVLCGMEEAAHATRTNEGPGAMAEQQVFTHFYQFIAMQSDSYEPCTPYRSTWSMDTHLVSFFLKEYERRPSQLHRLSTRTSNLTALVEYSVAWDRTIRKSYGGNMIYGDASVNLRHARSSIHVEEVNVAKVLYDLEWTKWMRGVYEDAVHGIVVKRYR